MAFQLDPVLAKDTLAVSRLPLSELRLMNNKRFPWLVLVPQVEMASEWIDLTREDQHRLADEMTIVSHIFQALVTPDKLNIAMLGNQVPQLHVHVIGRYRDDSAWPEPVWGRGGDVYAPGEAEGLIRDLKIGIESVLK